MLCKTYTMQHDDGNGNISSAEGGRTYRIFQKNLGNEGALWRAERRAVGSSLTFRSCKIYMYLQDPQEIICSETSFYESDGDWSYPAECGTEMRVLQNFK
jgi:hypothetical protein